LEVVESVSIGNSFIVACWLYFDVCKWDTLKQLSKCIDYGGIYGYTFGNHAKVDVCKASMNCFQRYIKINKAKKLKKSTKKRKKRHGGKNRTKANKSE
jgi:hypothetical protein